MFLAEFAVSVIMSSLRSLLMICVLIGFEVTSGPG